MNRLLSGATLAIDGDAWNVLRQAAHKTARAGDASGLRPDRFEVAEHDIVNHVGIDPRACYQ